MLEFPQTATLTDRQRAICLLLSRGMQSKKIAAQLDVGLRTVEGERHRVAKLLKISTELLVIWSVEHRHELIQESCPA